jgi:hypothetical protein
MRGRSARLGSVAPRGRRSSQANSKRSASSATDLNPSGHDTPVPAAIRDGEHTVAAGKELSPSGQEQDDARHRSQPNRDAPRQFLGHVAAVGETQLEPTRTAAAADDERPKHDTTADDARCTHRDSDGEAQTNADANAIERIGREDHGRVVISRLRAPGESHADVNEPRSAGGHRQRARPDAKPRRRVPARRAARHEPRTSAKVDRKTGSTHANDETGRAEVRQPHRARLASRDREDGRRRGERHHWARPWPAR